MFGPLTTKLKVMTNKPGKHYTEEFRTQAVELLRTGKPVPELAEELCRSTNLLYRWRRGTQVGSEGKRAVGEKQPGR